MSDDIDLLADLASPLQKEPQSRRERERLGLPARAAEVKPRWTPDQLEDDFNAALILNGGWPTEAAFLRPVGVTFLGTVFGKETRRIQKMLKGCPIVGYGTHGRGAGAPLYDFKEACSYLIPPKMDIKTLMSTLTPQSMPPLVSKAFYDAVRQRNKVMEESGDYWHSHDVVRLLGEVSSLIRDTTLLWVDDLPSKATISTEDYHALRNQVQSLLKEVQSKLVALVEKPEGLTQSVAEDLRQNEIKGLAVTFDEAAA